MKTSFAVFRLVHIDAADSCCSDTLQSVGGAAATAQTQTAAAGFFFCGRKYQQHSKGDQPAGDGDAHCRYVNTFIKTNCP